MGGTNSIVGKRIYQIAKLLGMQVLVAERKGATAHRKDRTPFKEVIKTCTVLVVVIPRTTDTINLISTAEFRAMHRSAVLVNISRGGIVDEAALIKALEGEIIAGAASDVFIQEPADSGNSIMVAARGLNLVLTPHIAWVSSTTTGNLQRIVRENVEAWCAGKPINVVSE
jgi:phosphoglycerate dehydrogenase-like enzyme